DLGKDETLDASALVSEKVQLVLGVTSQSRQRAQIDAVNVGLRRAVGQGVFRGRAEFPVVLFSPPTPRQSGYLATRLLIEAAEMGGPTRDGVVSALRKGKLFSEKLDGVKVDWGVATFAVPNELVASVKSSSGQLIPCNCCAKSGKPCKVEFCRDREMCSPTVKDDD